MHEEVCRQDHRVELQEGPRGGEPKVWELQPQTSRPCAWPLLASRSLHTPLSSSFAGSSFPEAQESLIFHSLASSPSPWQEAILPVPMASHCLEEDKHPEVSSLPLLVALQIELNNSP